MQIETGLWTPAFAGVTEQGMVISMEPCVYIVCNQRYGTLYIGVTSNLARRAYEHREGMLDGFTKRYSLNRLVWYEQHETMAAAITREKQMKAWKREWKIREIEQMNPTWNDLYETLNQ